MCGRLPLRLRGYDVAFENALLPGRGQMDARSSLLGDLRKAWLSSCRSRLSSTSISQPSRLPKRQRYVEEPPSRTASVRSLVVVIKTAGLLSQLASSDEWRMWQGTFTHVNWRWRGVFPVMALAHNAALFHGVSKCTPVNDIYACETYPIPVSDKLFLLICVLATSICHIGV